MRERWKTGWGWRTSWGQREWTLSVFTSWTSWLLGVQVERHPSEWQAWVHAGPVALCLFRVR